MKIKQTTVIFSLLFIATLAITTWQSIKVIQTSAMAYLYAYPLVLMDETRKVIIDPDNGRSPENHFTHVQLFPDHNFRQVVRPNNDTLYSSAWIDLSKQAMVLSVPDTAGRYYVMPFMDQWTNVFDSIGSRNTGTGAGDFLITGPNWKGENSENLHQIKAPNNKIWLIGRIQTNTEKDYENVRALQKGFKLASYSNWKQTQFNPAYFINFNSEKDNLEGFSIDPNDAVVSLSVVDFFERFQKLSIGKIPKNEIQEVSKMLSVVGISTVDKSYTKPGFIKKFLVQEGVDAAKNKMRQFISSKRSNENGWSVIRENIGRYGKAYPTRAIVALLGLGALPPEEAAYPTTNQDSSGETLIGSNRYRLHFAADELPPVEAFWSLTMYDEDGFFVDNPIKRYAIGDRDNLIYNDDGSLDLYIQHNQPENTNNWLPAPVDNFALTLRLYQPKTKFLDGTWRVPSVERQ